MMRVVFLLIFLIQLTSAKEVINFYIGEYPPYTSSKVDEPKIAQDQIRSIFSKANIEVNFVFIPWNRVYQKVKDQGGLGSFPWFKSEKREKVFLFSKKQKSLTNLFLRFF